MCCFNIALSRSRVLAREARKREITRCYNLALSPSGWGLNVWTREGKLKIIGENESRYNVDIIQNILEKSSLS